MTEAVLREVAAGEADLRLDRWFRRHYPDLSHGRLERLLRTGQVRVDGARVKAGFRLAAGQMVRVPPLVQAGPKEGGQDRPQPATPAPRPGDLEMLRDRILHLDPAVIVLDKPAGLAVQGGSGQQRHLDALLDLLRLDASERPRLVHRLDKDTSGVLVLARTVAAAAALTASFRGRATRKVYWAITTGVPVPAEGLISLPLAKTGRPGGQRVQVDAEQGLAARTAYRVLDRAARRAALLRLEPQTGRTHQLRVHCAKLGTPILGDGKYGGAGAFLQGAVARQLHLHARRITLPHPSGGILDAMAPLPPHMEGTMALLGLASDPSAMPD